jgi:hypothetical protein
MKLAAGEKDSTDMDITNFRFTIEVVDAKQQRQYQFVAADLQMMRNCSKLNRRNDY